MSNGKPGLQTRDAVRIASDLYNALARGDRAALDALLHPNFEGQATEGLPLDLGGSYSGPANMRRQFWGQIAKHFDARAAPQSFHALDDGRLMVSGRYIGEARTTGKALDAEFIHVLGFSGDKIDRLVQLTDSVRWQDALTTADGQLETIDFSIVDGLATICLNRPDARNAIDMQLATDLLEAARRCTGDGTVRAVLIKGNGPALTVGGDIEYFTEADPTQYGELFRRMTSPFHEAFRILSRLDAPIVTAAHGSVAGGGLGFVYAADIAIAAEGTKFATAFAGLGLSGDGGGTWYLPRLVGPRRAAQMYLQNRVLDATEALEWGLISEVVAADRLDEYAHSVAAALAAGPTRALGRMRDLLRTSWSNTLSEQFLEESEGIAHTGATEDCANAIESFLGKRRPIFEGR